MNYQINNNLAIIQHLKKNFNATDEELLKLEAFIECRYEVQLDENYIKEPLITHIDQVKNREDYGKLESLIDLNDFYLRVTEDGAITEIDLEDVTELFIRELYTVKSRNEYDLNFIFNNIDKKAFVNDCIKNKIRDDIKELNGKYYKYY